MPVIIIAAVSKNLCIGKDGAVPWRLPDDLRRFSKLTTDHVVIMGRKTWESLPDGFRPLPNRKNVVVTKQIDYPLPAGVERFTSLSDAIAAHTPETMFIIGGGEIYTQALPLAETLELTLVDQIVDGDVFFPEYREGIWKETDREDHLGYSFVTYKRI